jgi:RNA polymerase sigma factor (TIGR02999 family)
MSDVTRILSQIEQGDPKAAELLLPLVYNELRRLAAAKLAQEKPGQTLQATALVHEAYVRLVGDDNSQQWDNRGHFFAAAAEAMRRILIEQARRKQSDKRGGDRQRIDIEQIDLVGKPDHEEMLAFDDALTRFSGEDPEAARLVKLRYFVGLSVEQAGEAMGISRSSAYDHWVIARAWLRCTLGDVEL